MKNITFRGVITATAILTGLITAVLALTYACFSAGWLLNLTISFGTTFYHFAMRLLVGFLVPNNFNPHNRWFAPKPFEKRLYRALRVKQWKDRMPTYDPRLFSLTENTPDAMVKNMCQAEVVHEIIIVCSFVPLLFSLLWDSFSVFLITSVLAAAVDTLFAILQRYNRPRLIRLINKRRSQS